MTTTRKIDAVQPEVVRRFYVTHIGHVTVNNYGAVELETLCGGMVMAVDTVYDLSRGVRVSVAEMRKEGVYAR